MSTSAATSERLTKAQEKAADQESARQELRRLFPPGSTALTILRHVAPSGMSRWISVIATDEDGTSDVTWLLSRAGIADFSGRHEGAKVTGCGMDMGFHLVYSMSRALYPDGFACTGIDGHSRTACPANDHSNDRDGSVYSTERHHTEGGYAVRQRWL